MKKIVYFVTEFDVSNNSVLEAQVLTQAKHVEALGYKVVFIGAYSANTLNQAELKVREYVKDFKLYNINELNKKGFIGNLLSAIKIANYLNKEGWFNDIDYVYVRSLIGFLPLLMIRSKNKFKLVYDFRGLVSDEQRLKKNNIAGAIESKIIEWLEIFSFKKADKVLAVSHALADYLNSKSTIKKEITVIPCCAEFKDVLETISRREINIPESANLVCYSGGISKWQRIDLIIDTAIAVTEQRQNCYFMFLSKDIEIIRKILIDKNCQSINKMRFYSLQQQDVSKYLALADIGLLLREDILTNRVASPIKAAEYMAAGLALALSPNIGDISNMVVSNNIGVLLDETEDLSVAEQLIAYIETTYRPDQKTRIKEFAMLNFSWVNKSSYYRSLYT